MERVRRARRRSGAAGLHEMGARVGILDADVHGPNVPRIRPVEGDPGVTPDEELVPPRSEGVEWGRLDYLIVDLPPGTGDASLNLLQTLPVAGVVIVTTPQEMAVADARKGLRLFEEHDTPILGVVENMSTYRCPNCDDHDVFGSGEAQNICGDFDVPLLAELPVHPDFDSERIDGPAVRDNDNAVQAELQELSETVADRVGAVNRKRVGEDAADAPDESIPTGADADD